MTIITYASGSQTCTIGTEHFLSSPNVAGEFALYIDPVLLVAGDVLEVRAYKMAIASGTSRVMWYASFDGAQDATGIIKLSDWIPNSLTDTNAVRFSITQLTPSGGGRVIPWLVVQRTDQADLTKILGTALSETVGGYLAAGFKKLLDIAAPVLTLASVNQTGDNYTRIGAPAGASISADVAAVKTDTASLLSKLLKYVQLLARKDSAIATDNATELTAINASGGSGAGSFVSTTDSHEAIRDNMATVSGGVASADVTKINGSATLLALFAAMLAFGTKGTAITGTLTTTSFTTDLTITEPDDLVGRVVGFYSGALAYQGATITSYDGTTKTITCTELTRAPSNGDAFVIL